MRYIAHLLASPGQNIRAIDLWASFGTVGAPGVMNEIDTQNGAKPGFPYISTRT